MSRNAEDGVPYDRFHVKYRVNSYVSAVSDAQLSFLIIVSEFMSVNGAAVELAQLAGARKAPLQANG